MNPFDIYKHINNTDVAICIIKSFYVKERDYYKFKVRWMNVVNPNNVFDTGVQENLKIPRQKFSKEWVKI
jgi:hypothetical protein